MAVAHVVKSTRPAPFVMLMTVLPRRQMTLRTPPSPPLPSASSCVPAKTRSMFCEMSLPFLSLAARAGAAAAALCLSVPRQKASPHPLTHGRGGYLPLPNVVR
ncbi:unnamed protein product [Pleuronectes platessa]|uniref:Uncharacterized protein n=1 Tax=Pleuronectes platessa TaxID=8262 RepID=A0A9N7Z7A2_PLEPL|nr:unnamed protein product [Pleuronectes platessa]